MIAPILLSVFRKDRVRIQAETLYAVLAEQARAPEFYEKAGAPDTPEGRFDLLALHMFLALDRLRVEAPPPDRLIRLLQEIFFQRLDSALREMGVGDLSVGRKIRGMAEAFYGRVAAYERALAADDSALDMAIARNILGTADGRQGRLLGVYVRTARTRLLAAPIDELADGISGLGAESERLFSGDLNAASSI